MKKTMIAAVLVIGAAAFADAGIVIGVPGFCLMLGGRTESVETGFVRRGREALPPPPPPECGRAFQERMAPPPPDAPRRREGFNRPEPRFDVGRRGWRE